MKQVGVTCDKWGVQSYSLNGWGEIPGVQSWVDRFICNFMVNQ